MPSYADKLLQQAHAHHQSGNLLAAEPLYRKILSLEPNHLDARRLLAHLLFVTSRPAESADLLAGALRLNPRDRDLILQYTEACRAAARWDDAIASLRQAIANDPSFLEAHNNLGGLLVAKGEFLEADKVLLQALRLKPDHSESLLNLGNNAVQQGHLGQAATWYRRLLTNDPTYSSAWSNLAAVLQEQGLFADSINASVKAQTYAPNDALIFSSYLVAINRDDRLAPHAIAEAHRAYGRRLEDPLQPLRHPVHTDPTPNRTLRVGYVSFDFRRHSVAYFVEPLLACHDHSRFHITCYSSVIVPDEVTHRLQSHADIWRDVASLSDFDLTHLIREDQIDILIDLSGHTRGNRLPVFALRSAPIQITFLGYPNTTGLPEMDYRLTDPLADPPSPPFVASDSLHTEKLLRLPTCAWCYQPPTDSPPVAPSPAADHITFGSFNVLSKVTDRTLELWSSILAAIPSSRLLLKAKALADPDTQSILLTRLSQRGILPDRITLLPWDPSPAGHLATYSQIDIALDTYPYHGTTTTCESLFMGVPVITLAGQTHVSRVGVSLLTAAGLPELIASDPQSYLSIAQTLASDPQRLAHLRSTLRQRLITSSLCNAPQYTREIEAAYSQAWTLWCSQQQ